MLLSIVFDAKDIGE